MSTQDGGPAFPVVYNGNTPADTGMSLRDYLAAAALTGLLNDPAFRKALKGTEVAQYAYLVADTCLREREKRP